MISGSSQRPISRKSRSVIRGYANLNDVERQEVVDEINRINKEVDRRQRDLIEKSYREGPSLDLGPFPEACPCCGRGGR